MEVKNLMISDWVFDENKTPHQIAELGTTFCTDMNTELLFTERLSPIPLTEEILEKNGFVENKGSWWLRSNLFTLNIFVEGGYCASSFSEQVFINNVHTLQHALRICGLDNLADNFKITK